MCISFGILWWFLKGFSIFKLYFIQTPTVARCRLKSKLKTASEGAVVAGVSDKSSQWLSILATHRSTLTLAPVASSLTLTRPLQRQISCKSTTKHKSLHLASSCKMTRILCRLKKDDDDQKTVFTSSHKWIFYRLLGTDRNMTPFMTYNATQRAYFIS